MEALPLGAAVSWRAKGTWKDAQALLGLLEAVVAQTFIPSEVSGTWP